MDGLQLRLRDHNQRPMLVFRLDEPATLLYHPSLQPATFDADAVQTALPAVEPTLPTPTLLSLLIEPRGHAVVPVGHSSLPLVLSNTTYAWAAVDASPFSLVVAFDTLLRIDGRFFVRAVNWETTSIDTFKRSGFVVDGGPLLPDGRSEVMLRFSPNHICTHGCKHDMLASAHTWPLQFECV